jgi:hypothetical protein
LHIVAPKRQLECAHRIIVQFEEDLKCCCLKNPSIEKSKQNHDYILNSSIDVGSHCLQQ